MERAGTSHSALGRMSKIQKSRTEDFLPQQNDAQPSVSPTIKRPEHMNLADELARTAEAITWSRAPELREFESTAELIVTEGNYDMADLVDASANERTQLFKRLAEDKAGRDRALRKISDS